MNVSAVIVPAEANIVAGGVTTFSLQLHNATDVGQVAILAAEGELASSTIIQTERLHLDPHERFDIPVTVAPPPSVSAGAHECRIKVIAGGQTLSAVAVVGVAAHNAFVARLEPVRARSSKCGRFEVVVENVGNMAVLVDLTARTGLPTHESLSGTGGLAAGSSMLAPPAAPAALLAPPTPVTAFIELALERVIVEPGATSRIKLGVTPVQTYWNGDPQTHPFVIDLTGDHGERVALDGVYEQIPRMRPWVGAALAGALGALLIWLLAWFFLMRPAIENIAVERASELDATQQAELERRVEEIQIAAEEASELPLGEPTDLRLSIAAAPGAEASDVFDFDRSGTGRTLSISDIIFQNPTGAVGTVEFLRDGEVLLQQEMANFRDLDFSLVAPFRVDSGSSIGLRVVCTSPGPTTGECQVAATIVGFVDG